MQYIRIGERIKVIIPGTSRAPSFEYLQLFPAAAYESGSAAALVSAPSILYNTSAL